MQRNLYPNSMIVLDILRPRFNTVTETPENSAEKDQPGGRGVGEVNREGVLITKSDFLRWGLLERGA